MNTKKIAEMLRELADTYDTGSSNIVNTKVDLLREIAEELDQPAPRPLLADAEVGWVCRLKNGEWVTITEVDTECRMPIRTSDSLWYELDGTADTIPMEMHIIHAEPLAAEGSAEWALNEMRKGWKVTKEHLSRIYWFIDDLDCVNEVNCGTIQIKIVPEEWIKTADTQGWQIYVAPKPEPEPAPFSVGDWVTDGVVTGKIIGCGMGIAYVMRDDKGYPLDFANLRKLSPSEVRVKITLEGTVHKIDGNNLAFELEDEKGVVTCVGYQQLDPDTAKLVRELADK